MDLCSNFHSNINNLKIISLQKRLMAYYFKYLSEIMVEDGFHYIQIVYQIIVLLK